MDVDSAFLQANLNKEIYIQQPKGFIDAQHPDKVWHLMKSLYGLKQAPMVWNKTIDGHLWENGFIPTKVDPCVYVQWQGNQVAIIALYVDDLVILSHMELLAEMKKVLLAWFPIKDLEELSSILRIEIL